jgi:hypothetical protein
MNELLLLGNGSVEKSLEVSISLKPLFILNVWIIPPE